MTAFVLGPASFEASIAAARKRGSVLASDFYGVLRGEARAAAFTVSRLATVSLVEEIRESLIRDMSNGGDFKAWQKRILATPRFGHLTPAHLETIYRTNAQAHYAAGRAISILRNKGTHPYLMYSAVLDTRVRPAHAALDGIILPVEHPFWKTHFPPLGFNCRCRVVALTKGQAERALARNPQRGEPPPGTFVDKGWDYDRLGGTERLGGPTRAVVGKAKKAPVAKKVLTAEEKEAKRAAAYEAAVARETEWLVEQTLSTRAAEIEYWSVIAGDGRLIGRGKGQRNVVAHEDMPANVSRYLNKQSNGATFLHSHPTTITGAHRSSLSGSDLRSQFRSAYREIIAVTDVGGGVYRARATVNVFLRTFADATEEAQELALKISRDAQSRVGPHYQKYKHEIWEFENLTAYGHIANLIMSEWGYIRYTATNLSKDEMFLERYMRAHVALPKRPFGL